MRLLFVVERPTQFEAPFYRYAATRSEAELQVLFTRHDAGREVYDPELGRQIGWGFDLLAGYESAVAPAGGRTARWISREIARRRPDLVIVNGYTRRDYLAAALGARLRGMPAALRTDTVLWPGTGRPPASRRLLYRAALPRLFRLFLTTGTLGRRFLEACGVAPDRIGLFPYAVDVEHFHSAAVLSPAQRHAARAELGIPADARVVLAVAKMSEREAPWDLLRGLAGLAGEERHLLVVGDGPQRPALEAFAAGHPGGRVTFTGYVPYPALPRLYGLSDLFVHPAGEERWGVSVAEALAAGLPVVTSSRVGAGYDLVRPGANGAVYEAGDPAALARAVTEVSALDPSTVRETNRAILAAHDYRASWEGLVEAAARVVRTAAVR